jgi:hypothetical protein
MKITDALVQMKSMKEQISRLYNIRKEHFTAIIPKEVTVEDMKKDPKKYNVLSFDEVTKEITEIEEKVTDLREKVQKTNVATVVKLENGEEVTLARLKLKVDDYRSRLSQLMSLSRGARGWLMDRRSTLSKDDEEKQVTQMDDLEIEKLIKKHEEEKNKLQLVLDTTNAKTDLVD